MGFGNLVVTLGLEYEGWHSSIGQTTDEKLVFRLRASSFWDELTLETGGDLMKMEGYLHLSLHDQPNDTMTVPAANGDDEKIIELLGSLWYLPAFEGSSDGVAKPSEEAFSVECGVSPMVFESLRDAIRANEGPQLIHISIPMGLGLEYGSAPDGSVKSWDNSEKRFLSISGLSFSFEKMKPEKADGFNEAGGQSDLPRKELESDRIEMIGHSFATVIQQLTNIRYLLLGLIAVVLISRLI